MSTPCKRKAGQTSIDGAECETKNSVALCILHELRAHLLSELHCLFSNGDPADSYIICIDVATGRASIAISDIPSITGQLLSSA